MVADLATADLRQVLLSDQSLIDGPGAFLISDNISRIKSRYFANIVREPEIWYEIRLSLLLPHVPDSRLVNLYEQDMEGDVFYHNVPNSGDASVELWGDQDRFLDDFVNRVRR